MVISAEEKEFRRGSIGASDIGAIMNISPFVNAHDIFMQKVYGTDEPKSEAIDIGNDCEPMLVTWAHQQIGADWTLAADVKISKPIEKGYNFPHHANLDGLLVKGDQRIGIEAKTSSMYQAFGEDGSDEIPDHIIMQCQWQIWTADLEKVAVPVLTAEEGLKRKLYWVERNDQLIDQAIMHGKHFWEENVVKEVAPEEVSPSLETLKRVRREPETSVKIDENLVREWRAKEDIAREAAKEAKEAKARVLATLGNAEAGVCDLGTLTYFEQARKEFTVKASTSRVARWKGNKK